MISPKVASRIEATVLVGNTQRYRDTRLLCTPAFPAMLRKILRFSGCLSLRSLCSLWQISSLILALLQILFSSPEVVGADDPRQQKHRCEFDPDNIRSEKRQSHLL